MPRQDLHHFNARPFLARRAGLLVASGLVALGLAACNDSTEQSSETSAPLESTAATVAPDPADPAGPGAGEPVPQAQGTPTTPVE